ncbi:hypothetical protein [Fervidibacter sacchari]|jgi:hypothetical protein|uniref:AbrB family transcriptional regulator n=1 Tax=Candidatus Fervidibacter sacchari TaxID=1448929 RepID=A0ABT2EQP5_9BACT|nr:hypothetical protein [Candidatus Fervidibacter sacchari]MCS3920266.1 hypothetical protein [Candidatus Fervidibacter sacchari]WKU14768.1 hypothetical protein Q2T83_10520 [Candidatus Fervidibacter sacchari]
MAQRRWKGIVKSGAVVLEEPLPLPDGTTVFIIPETEGKTEPEFDADPFLRVDEWLPKLDAPLPPDLAERFDEYLYGDAWQEWERKQDQSS